MSGHGRLSCLPNLRADSASLEERSRIVAFVARSSSAPCSLIMSQRQRFPLGRLGEMWTLALQLP
jgi:hypothetical protein